MRPKDTSTPRQRAPPGNRLLAALPEAERERLRKGCERVELSLGEVLFEPGSAILHVHFPVTAYVSLLAPVDGSARVEVGLVGNEGLVGTPSVLGVAHSPLHAIVQGAGASLRIEAAAFQREMGRCPALRAHLDRYLFVRMTQLAQASACTRFHLVGARLARWYLMTQDRAHSSDFRITHEFLARMLGVRRAGVTQAASALQAGGFIRYSRGHVRVLDRTGLKAASCTCYAIDRETYRKALG